MDVTIVAYMTQWCSDCMRARRVLQRSGMAYEEIDIDKTPGAEEAMRGLNGGSGKVPTILLQRGPERRILIEPNERELTEALRACGEPSGPASSGPKDPDCGRQAP